MYCQTCFQIFSLEQQDLLKSFSVMKPAPKPETLFSLTHNNHKSEEEIIYSSAWNDKAKEEFP